MVNLNSKHQYFIFYSNRCWLTALHVMGNDEVTFFYNQESSADVFSLSNLAAEVLSQTQTALVKGLHSV